MAGDPQSLHPTNWKTSYRVALLETNDSVVPIRISEAEEAIVQRTQEIFREAGADAAAEREEMDDAKYALRAWKTAMENRTHAA